MRRNDSFSKMLPWNNRIIYHTNLSGCPEKKRLGSQAPMSPLKYASIAKKFLTNNTSPAGRHIRRDL